MDYLLSVKFIHYNPHSYMIDGVKQKINQQHCHEHLLETLLTTSFYVPFSVQ